MANVKAEAKIINNKTKRKGKLGSSDRDKILADLKKHGIGAQEMREFLTGKGYHPDDIEEMVSMTTLDADFGLNEYEETESACDIYCEDDENSKDCCKCKNGVNSKKYQEADFEFGKEEEYEEVTRKDKKTVMRIKGKGTLTTVKGMSNETIDTMERDVKGKSQTEGGSRTRRRNENQKKIDSVGKYDPRKSSRYQDLKF